MAGQSLHSLDAVLAGLHSLAETAEAVEDEALRQRLTGTIVSLRGVILTVREEFLQMQDSNEQLRAQAPPVEGEPAPRRARPPRMKWGCYQFDDSEGVFCTVSYDTRGRKVRATRVSSNSHVCPVCRTVFPTY
jgi:hypothetical protein